MDFAVLVEQFAPPELVWGLVPRVVGALYILSMASLLPQVSAIIGSRGMAPIAQRLSTMRRHFPGPRRFFDLPTLFWLNQSDAFVRLLPVVGIGAGALAVYGGEYGFWGLLIGWVCLLSLDVCALMFPWDCMLLEVGFLALWLPAVEALPDGHATGLPLPAVAFMFRILVIRLMWGFAKIKFIGTRQGDQLYLQGFLTWMPMPSPAGWLMQHAPDWVLRLAYYFMWGVEVLCPLAAFFTGELRLIAFAGLVSLMLGIWLTGNWGFFNLGYIAVCLVLLDTSSSILDIAQDPTALYAPWPNLLTNAVMAVLCFGSLLYFPFNSWCSQTWIQWPFDDITWKRPWLQWLINFFRFLAPFRVLNAYGVFPPNHSPPLKLVPRIEGSDDGENWRVYRYKFMPTTETCPPRFIAPHHPRIDHSCIYAGAGITDSNLLASILGIGRPYTYSPYSHYSWLHRVVQRLLEGDRGTQALLGENPFPDGPPRWIRVSHVALTPTTLRERRQTGRWWHARRMGELLPATERDALVWQNWLPEPECFHPDFVHQMRRAPSLQAVLSHHARSGDVHAAVRADSDFSEQEVQAFWGEVIPFVAAPGRRNDWDALHETVAELRRRHGEAQLQRFERLLERYVFLLRPRLEPYFYGDCTPSIELENNIRFHFLMQEAVFDGREAYERLLSEPERAAERASRSDHASALYPCGVFRYEMMQYHFRTFRVIEALSQAPPLPLGVGLMSDFLKSQDTGPLWTPTCEQADNGHWQVRFE